MSVATASRLPSRRPVPAVVVRDSHGARRWRRSRSAWRTSRSLFWSRSRSRCSSSVTGSEWRRRSSSPRSLWRPPVSRSHGDSFAGSAGAFRRWRCSTSRVCLRESSRRARLRRSSGPTPSPGFCSSARPRRRFPIVVHRRPGVLPARRTAAPAQPQFSWHVPCSPAPSQASSRVAVRSRASVVVRPHRVGRRRDTGLRDSGSSWRLYAGSSTSSSWLDGLLVTDVNDYSSALRYDYDFFLGPVNAMRHGHPLLVDTFSQYGVGMFYALAERSTPSR